MNSETGMCVSAAIKKCSLFFLSKSKMIKNSIFRTSRVTAEYPHYQVEISGVGVPPEGHEEVGYCSQLAVFIRDAEYNPKLMQVILSYLIYFLT